MKKIIVPPASLVSAKGKGTSRRIGKVWILTGSYARNAWNRDSDKGRKYFRIGRWALAAQINFGSIVIATTVWDMNVG